MSFLNRAGQKTALVRLTDAELLHQRYRYGYAARTFTDGYFWIEAIQKINNELRMRGL